MKYELKQQVTIAAAVHMPLDETGFSETYAIYYAAPLSARRIPAEMLPSPRASAAAIDAGSR